jgi:heme/copper-type cytochrome/quinol oxidase subunit 1
VSVVLIIPGFIDHVGKELSGLQEKMAISKLTVVLLVLGGYGFLSMFYWAGAHSVPRRYAISTIANLNLCVIRHARSGPYRSSARGARTEASFQ